MAFCRYVFQRRYSPRYYAIRGELTQAGFSEPIVQNYGSSQDVLIRIAPIDGVKNVEIGDRVVNALQTADPGTEKRGIAFVGPNIGDELAEQGGLAMLVSLLCILVYVAMRFEWRFALGSVIALAHDVILTLGLFSILQLEFDLTVLAAVLAVIGYSLNDTIVVSDRIRENFRKIRNSDTEEIINISLTESNHHYFTHDCVGVDVIVLVRWRDNSRFCNRVVVWGADWYILIYLRSQFSGTVVRGES